MTLGVLRVVHPFPSLLNAVLVAAIAGIAGAAPSVVVVLALAMLLIQFTIGIANDVFDLPTDRLGRPTKPLVRGDLSRASASFGAIALGAGGLALATTQGFVEVGLLAAMLGAGLAYDIALKRLGLGWLAYAIAFPLLPAYAWFGAAGTWPPRYETLLPIAALAGPALALANGVVDAERDRAAGTRTIVVRLGRTRSVNLMAGLLLAIHVIAWLTAAPAGPAVTTLMIAAGSLAAIGVRWSAARDVAVREWGWKAQTVAIGSLAGAWFLGTVVPVA